MNEFVDHQVTHDDYWTAQHKLPLALLEGSNVQLHQTCSWDFLPVGGKKNRSMLTKFEYVVSSCDGEQLSRSYSTPGGRALRGLRPLCLFPRPFPCFGLMRLVLAAERLFGSQELVREHPEAPDYAYRNAGITWGRIPSHVSNNSSHCQMVSTCFCSSSVRKAFGNNQNQQLCVTGNVVRCDILAIFCS